MGGQSHVFSEISFPPFNLVMSVSGGCPDASLFDITWFKEYAHRELRTVKLTLNNLAVNSYFPGDYRTFDELKSITLPQSAKLPFFVGMHPCVRRDLALSLFRADHISSRQFR